MAEQSEEERRRRKIILDGEVAQMAAQNIGPVMSGQLSIDQVEELIEIDEDYLARTRACVSPPDSPAAV